MVGFKFQRLGRVCLPHLKSHLQSSWWSSQILTACSEKPWDKSRRVVKSHCSRSLTMEEFPSVSWRTFFSYQSLKGPRKENTPFKLIHTEKVWQKREGYSVSLCVCVLWVFFFCSDRCLVMSQHTLMKYSLSEPLWLTAFLHTHTLTWLPLEMLRYADM